MKYEDSLQLVLAFRDRAVEENGIVILGIDPGITGAMALSLVSRDGKRVLKTAVMDIPTTQIKKNSGKGRSEYDHTGILGLLKPLLVANRKGRLELHACIEKTAPNVGMQSRIRAAMIAKKTGKKARVFAGDTPITAFSMGWSGGMWPLFLQSWNVSLTLVVPATWKGHLKLHRQDKEASRQMATRQFPKLAIRYLSAKSHHNRAEALLLVIYYFRFILNGKRTNR